jgi:uncharacterized membrane protein YcaP (DUF421 family)
VTTADAVLARLRFVPGLQRVIDPPVKVLIRDGRIEDRNLRRCGFTCSGLDAVPRQQGHSSADNIHLAILDATGTISILPSDRPG